MSSEDDGFNSKNWVWVPDDGNCFTKGHITDYLSDGKCKVTVINGNNESHRIVASSSLESCNPAKFNKCDDMAELTHLNEPSIIYNLFLRYNDDLIYTYSGLFLVAINPYKSLPIYENDMLKKFHNSGTEKPSPHIFATAEGTYRNLLTNHKDQSILVTGESGAGKTENTKKIIQYLSSITPSDDSYNNNHYIDTKILQANPILESFGNAKTIKNNNSSRFGKFIKIFFSSKGVINGANIDYYLLEKSRVVSQSDEERNYHVFYQFLKGYEKLKLQELGLNNEIKNYNYLSNSKFDIPNIDDGKEFILLIEAFKIMGFADTEIKNVFSILAVILHLGNIDFTSWKAEQASFKADAPIDVIVRLLGIQRQDFIENLLRPKVKAGREMVQKSRKAPEAKYSIDALAKHLYERVFKYIIERINHNLRIDSSDDQLHFIGVLDIAGFEIFQQNSFEQLCINYTNEKLQQFFNHHSFILEQSEYLREDIQWEFIDFGLDLQPTIDLIETKQPMGVLEILDEECVIPKATDKTFMEKLAANWGKGQSKKFQENKLKNGFIIHHYAGVVEYNADNWLQKNADPISEHLLKLLPDSNNKFVSDLFFNDEHILAEKNSNKRANMLKTASQKHKEQLNNLMKQLGCTEPHFVRCILPNLEKKPNKFNKSLVLHQLRCNGVLEGIRITRAGYPNRMNFDEFFSRYSIINVKEVFTKNNKTNSELILRYINLDSERYKVGITKIFFKNGILGKLEELRDLSLKCIFTDLQSVIRGTSARTNIKSQIKEIQSSQLIARTFKKVDESLSSSLWLDLFINIKPLLEESIKVLDSKEINENLKNVNAKLKDAEKSRANLEIENTKLKDQMTKLENEIISTTDMVKERDQLLEKFKIDEKKGNERIEHLQSQMNEIETINIKLIKVKTELDKKLKDVTENLKEKSFQFESLNNQYESKAQKIIALEDFIKNHEQEKKKQESFIADLKRGHESAKALALSETDQLKELNKQLLSDLENEKTVKVENESLTREIEALNGSIRIHKDKALENEKRIKSLQSTVKPLEVEIKRLEKELSDHKAELRDVGAKLDKDSKALELSSDKCKKLDIESEKLREEIKSLKFSESNLKKMYQEQLKDVEEITSLKEKLKSASNENKSILKSFQELKVEYSSILKAKEEFSDQIITLSNKLKDYEDISNDKEVGKENIPPDPSFVEDFANIKLKLNEQSAILRREKFENKKLTEEINMLKSRIGSDIAKGEIHPNRRSIAIGEDITLKTGLDILQDEIESLKLKLQHEEANSQRAENYAIQLQKKLNKLQSTRGLNSWTDFEKKYREAQIRITELESRFEKFVVTDNNGPRPLSKSESFNRNSLINKTLANSNQDFVVIYQDITRTLRTTREELSTAKSEILRLKSLLRESEDELYEVKRQTFRSSVSDYEEELAQLRVNHDTLSSKNADLIKSVELYKKRSDEYYSKLEHAEAAINISKRHEDVALRELSEVKNQLKLAREESRTTQILIKDIRTQNSSLEEIINDKNFEIQQLQNEIKELNDKIEYHTKNYENKELNDNYREEIRTLHKELNFKMAIETNLIKENKKLQLDYEDLVREKDLLAKEFEVSSLKLEELQDQSSELSKKLRALENEKVIHGRKINNLTKQVNSLKELVSEVTAQRDELLEVKDNLEEQILKLTQKLEETTAQLERSQSDMNILREHLENQRQESSEIRSELNQSKILSKNEVQDYQKLRKEILVTTEENDSLKKVNRELNEKVSMLEEKLYGNEQLKYWESKVDDLTKEFDRSQNENYESSKVIKSLERKVKQLEIRVENESQLTKKYNDENFDYQSKVNHFKSTIDILHNENSEKDLLIKASERESLELKENMLLLQKEVFELREKLGINT